MYSLQVTTSYAESWRYNIMVTLSLQNSEGEQVGYHSAEDSPLPIDANCDEAPEGWSRRRIVAIEFEPCNKVRFYVYLLPNSIPQVTTLAGEQTVFPMQVKIDKKQTLCRIFITLQQTLCHSPQNDLPLSC